MSREIDERVVEMKFRDADFNRGVDNVVTRLDKLKDALAQKISGKNFDELSNSAASVNFKPVEDQLESLNKKFGIVGSTARTVWDNIVTGGMNAAKNLVSKAIDPLINGGMKRALNMEQAMFMFSNMEGVDPTAMMKAASNAVDGTAYSLDVAAKSAAQFASSGIQIGEMEGVLKAVAGTAAMGGSSFEHVSEIFTKVAGQGRLMGDDLLRTGSLGLNVAAELGKSMNKTETEIRDMVTKGKISFQDFSNAMQASFGDAAGKANDTFNGAMQNLKSAFSRIGADVFSPGIQKLRDLFNTVRPFVNDFRQALQPLIAWDIEKQWDAPVGAINEKFAQFIDRVRDGIKSIDLGYFYDLFRNLATAMREGISSGDGLSNTMRGLGAILKIVGSALKLVVHVAVGIGSVVATLIGWFLQLTGVIATWIVKLQESIASAGGFVAIFEKLISPIRNFFRILKEGADGFKGIEGERFSIDETPFTKAAQLIHDWFVKLDSVGEGATAVIKGFGAVVSDVGSVIKTAFTGDFTGSKSPFAIFQEDGPLVGAALRVNELFETIKNLFKYLATGNFDGNQTQFAIFNEDGPIMNGLEKLRATKLTAVIDTVKEMWRVLSGGDLQQGPEVYGALQPIMEMLSHIYDWADNIIKTAIDMWNALTKGAVNFDSSILESDWGVAIIRGLRSIHEWGVKAGDTIRQFAAKLKIPTLAEFKQNISNAADAIKNVWSAFTKGEGKDSSNEIQQQFVAVGKTAFQAAKDIHNTFNRSFEKPLAKVKAKWEELKAPITEFSDTVKTAFSNAFEGAKEAGAGNIVAVITAISTAISKLIEKISQFKISDFLGKIKSGFSNIGSTLSEAFRVLTTGDLMQGPDVYGKLEPLMQGLKKIHDIAVQAANGIKDAFSATFDWFGERFSNFGANIGPMFANFIENAKAFGKAIATFVGPVVSTIGEYLAPAIEKVKDALSKLSAEQWVRIVESIAQLGMMGFLKSITKDLSAFGVGGIFSNANDSLKQLTATLKEFQKDVKAKNLLTIALAIGILAAAVFVLGGMESDQIVKGIAALATIGGIVTGIAVVITLASEKIAKAFNKFSDSSKDGEKGLKNFEKVTGLFRNLKWITIAFSIVIFATAVLILAGAMKLLTGVGWGEIGGFITIMLSVALMAKVLSSSEASFARAGAGLVVFSLGLMAMVGVMNILGKMDRAQLEQGMLALIVLMAYVALFAVFVSGAKVDKKTTAGIVALGEALKTMAKVVQMLGEMDEAELERGVVAVGILSAFVIAVAKFSNFARNGSFMQSGAGVLMVAAGIMVLALAVKMLGSMNIPDMIQGLIAVFGLITALTVAMNLMPKDMTTKAAQMLALAGAVAILALAIRLLGGMDLDSLGAAVGALVVTMFGLAVAMNFLPTNPVQTAGVIALAGAMMILAIALKTMGSLSWQELLIGLVGLAGAMALLLGAGAIAGNFPVVAAGMLALAGAVALIGAGMLAAGIGMTLFAAAMAAIGVAAVPFAAGLIAIGAALMVVIPLLAIGLANAIVEMVKVFGSRAGELKEAFIQLLQALIDAIVESIPMMVEGFALLLIAIIEKLIEYFPIIQEKGHELLMMLLTGIRDRIEEVTIVAMEILENFLNGIAAKIEDVVDAGINIIVNFLNGIAKRIGDVIDAGVNIIVAFLNGIRDAIPQIGDAAFEVIEAFCRYVVDNFDRLTTLANDTIATLGSKLSSAITSGIGNLLGVGKEIIGNIAEGLYLGLTSIPDKIFSAAASLGSGIVSSINGGAGNSSPSKYTYKSGIFVGQGLINGLNSQTRYVEASGAELGTALITAITVAVAAARNMADDLGLDPVITPVLDLSNIETGVNQMAGMLNTDTKLNLGADVASVKQIAWRYSSDNTNPTDTNAGGSTANTSVTFTQNNYSPKHLPKSEIYRQTRNQLSRVKEVVNRP